MEEPHRRRCMTTAVEHTDEHTDYDSPWKEVLERYFKEFMRNWDVFADDATDVKTGMMGS
jgi:hypothetical protein